MKHQAALTFETASRRSRVGLCPFCRRHLLLTFHHLIPRKLHRRKHYRRHYSREALGRGIYICRDCHDGIHSAYSEAELGARFNTPQRIAEDPSLQRHFAWLSRQRRAVS